MKIHYKAVGELKKRLGTGEGTIECEAGSSISNLIDNLGIENKGLVIMVNGRKVGSEEILGEEDRITIIPVAIGG